MEKVLGIGGLFFRAKEPDVLARWYAEHLGVALPPESYDQRSGNNSRGLPYSPRSEPTAIISAAPSNNG